MMDWLFAGTLSLHIAAGTLALAAAAAALALRKGAPGHRRAGQLYAGSMLAVTLTALLLAISRPSPFLLAITVFSFYLVFTGWRAATLRDGRPRPADAAAMLAMLLTAAAMLAWGGWRLLAPGQPAQQALVLLAFGAIGLALALQDLGWLRRGGAQGPARIARHLTRMLAGTIATVTAVAVVNLRFLPEVVVWLAPTLLLTPLITWWNFRLLSPGKGAGVSRSARRPASRGSAGP